ncbi:hypothetical protein EDD17DRAFT_1561467 [Pisolithus thermaeus]|nr:hypothetical protein F5141DRAFT_1111189 [Pisolithus sp. B1]KAI6164605.1 hypothetical protein EDD17DRAFT_1561467 [Pisolithus thermaeus]
MRLSLLGSLSALVVVATAASIETNAERLARGLPPLPPANVARVVDIRGDRDHTHSKLPLSVS